MGQFNIIGTAQSFPRTVVAQFPEVEWIGGDARLSWQEGDAESVRVAGELFDAMLKAQHLAFETDEQGQHPDQIREFDPTAKRILFSRPFVGG
jgi:hypothetical protein